MTDRSAARALLAALAVGALALGCSGRPLTNDGGSSMIVGAGGSGGGASTGTAGTFVATRKVDMLFVIKNSGSPRLMQDNLVRNFPTFMQRLMDPPGLPDLHVAVVTSDLGAGDGSISGCDSTGGDQGIFQFAPRGSCISTGLHTGATFIADSGAQKNYDGNLSDVFTCIAAVGSSGCGFEHELAAITRALGADGKPAPDENAGFLRDDAALFILVLADEDDCSAPPGSVLFDTKINTNLASPLGPPSSYRCAEFGHTCNGAKPPRLAPNGAVGDRVTLDGCVSAEGGGLLLPVATIAAQIRALKPFPDQQIFVTAIAGPPAPYTVEWRKAGATDTGPRPVLTPSCVGSDGSLATPGVRLAQWTGSFGAPGLFLTVCSDNFGPALDQIASHINEALPR